MYEASNMLSYYKLLQVSTNLDALGDLFDGEHEHSIQNVLTIFSGARKCLTFTGYPRRSTDDRSGS